MTIFVGKLEMSFFMYLGDENFFFMCRSVVRALYLSVPRFGVLNDAYS